MTTLDKVSASAIVHDERGETLVETLVSVLVSSLAVLMLAVAVGTAVRIVMSSRKGMQTLLAEEKTDIVNELGSGGAPTGEIDLSVDVPLRRNSSGVVEKEDVYLYFSTPDDSDNPDSKAPIAYVRK